MLVTCLVRTVPEELAETLQLILDVYPDEGVTRLLATSFPDRTEVLEVIDDVLQCIKARWSSSAPEVRKGFAPIYPALVAVRHAALRDVVDVSVEEIDAGIKSAIEHLRRTCGEGMLPCLLSWPE